MEWMVYISLSLWAVGIFFIPTPILAVIACLLLILDLVLVLVKGKQITGQFFKNLGFIVVFLVPLSLVKIFAHHEGKLYRWGKITVFSGGLEEAAVAAIRITVLFLSVFPVVKIILPVDKMKKKYGGWGIFRVLFQAIELFPSMMEIVSSALKRKKDRKLQRVHHILDEIYIRNLPPDKS